jgi:hypothetical protein
VRDRLQYIRYLFQEKTRFTDFLLELLARHFEVEVFFFQVNPGHYVNYFRGLNIVFVLMYSVFPVSKRCNLLFLRRTKWLCFSEKHRPFFGNADSIFVKDYPETRPFSPVARAGGFFL